MLVRYSVAPAGIVDGRSSARSCGRRAATRDSVAQTTSGESVAENTVDTEMACVPPGRLRLVNDAPANTEFGITCRPLPVSRWVARQFTSTTRPRAVGVSSQSPIWKGCSNNSSRPETIWPTEFCSARPNTMELTPSAVNRPPTLAPQTTDRISARPMAIIVKRATSRKIVGIRWRQLPSGALANRVALRPDSNSTSTTNPSVVDTIRTGVVCTDTWLAPVNSTSSAASGRM